MSPGKEHSKDRSEETLGFLQVFVLLFIFVKRQIMRFAVKSRRGPHVPLGHNAPKVTHTSTPMKNVNDHLQFRNVCVCVCVDMHSLGAATTN